MWVRQLLCFFIFTSLNCFPLKMSSHTGNFPPHTSMQSKCFQSSCSLCSPFETTLFLLPPQFLSHPNYLSPSHFFFRQILFCNFLLKKFMKYSHHTNMLWASVHFLWLDILLAIQQIRMLLFVLIMTSVMTIILIILIVIMMTIMGIAGRQMSIAAWCCLSCLAPCWLL